MNEPMKPNDFYLYVWFSGQQLNASVHQFQPTEDGELLVSYKVKDEVVFTGLLNSALMELGREHRIIYPADGHTTIKIINIINKLIETAKDEDTNVTPLFARNWRHIREVRGWEEAYFPGDVSSVVQVRYPEQSSADEKMYIKLLMDEFTEKFKEFDWRITEFFYDFVKGHYEIHTTAAMSRRFSDIRYIREFFENCVEAGKRDQNKHGIGTHERERLVKVSQEWRKRFIGTMSSNHPGWGCLMRENHTTDYMPDTFGDPKLYLDILKFYFIVELQEHASVYMKKLGRENIYDLSGKTWPEIEKDITAMLAQVRGETNGKETTPVVE